MRSVGLLKTRNGLKSLIGFLIAFATGFLGAQTSATAQTCGSDYTIKQGESLADIAARAYGSASQWTLIFYANQDRMGANASLLVPGLNVRIPCLAGQQPSPAPAAPATPPVQQSSSSSGTSDAIELSSAVRRIEFLTADGLNPYTDRSLSKGGMITHIIGAAMDLIKDQSAGNFSYNISWVNDWAAHLNPLLVTRAFDVGFPWLKPDCSNVTELAPDVK